MKKSSIEQEGWKLWYNNMHKKAKETAEYALEHI